MNQNASLSPSDAGEPSICCVQSALDRGIPHRYRRLLLHDVRRRANSRPCQIAKATRAKIVIVITIIFRLLIDCSCS